MLIATASGEQDGVLPAYQRFYEASWHLLIAYIHDDVKIHDPDWEDRVLREFQDPHVGVVGFGGATVFGRPDIYKRPYEIMQLTRFDFRSNLDDAEKHGTRFTGSCDVAFLDGFCLIVRRELLDKMGGWQPEKWPPHHVYDLRLACEARRHGYQMRLVGVSCHHQGGRTATSAEYQEWAKTTRWGSDAEMHAKGHRMIYEEYRDVLPFGVGLWKS